MGLIRNARLVEHHILPSGESVPEAGATVRYNAKLRDMDLAVSPRDASERLKQWDGHCGRSHICGVSCLLVSMNAMSNLWAMKLMTRLQTLRVWMSVRGPCAKCGAR